MLTPAIHFDSLVICKLNEYILANFEQGFPMSYITESAFILNAYMPSRPANGDDICSKTVPEYNMADF